MNLAIIPARAGSKRIVNKNIADLDGKPLLYYPLKTALDTGLFSEVMVSTDSEEIAAISQKIGASVPFLRSELNSSDHATTIDVLKEVVSFYKNLGKNFVNVCCIYPTAIFLTGEHLKQSYKKLADDSTDGVVATTNYDFHPLRSFRHVPAGYVAYNWPEFANARSQDLPELFHDAGMFYWCNTVKMLQGDILVTERFSFYHIDRLSCQDIDYPEDLEVARFKFNYLKFKG